LPQCTSGKNITDKEDIIDLHLDVIEDLLGSAGNIVFPTHTWGLVRTSITFDPERTPCDYLISEHLRTKRACARQLHPYASVGAIGPDRHIIIPEGLSRNVYGYGAPFEKLAAMNALHLSIGIPVRNSISAVHHCEFVAGVPYRYTKSFSHPCMQNGKLRDAEIFLFVTYRTANGLRRDSNQKIMQLPKVAPHLKRQMVGRSAIESIPLSIFIPEVIHAMQFDPYIWLAGLEMEKPWTQ
jgi:hypothetical protein